MIEFILAEACNGCGRCVEICPTDVFGPGPVIARPENCQTCFMCELYCPQDALFVGPDAERVEGFEPAAVAASGLMGEMRRDHGWDEWAGDPRYPNDHWRMESVFARAASLAPGPGGRGP